MTATIAPIAAGGTSHPASRTPALTMKETRTDSTPITIKRPAPLHNPAATAVAPIGEIKAKLDPEVGRGIYLADKDTATFRYR